MIGRAIRWILLWGGWWGIGVGLGEVFGGKRAGCFVYLSCLHGLDLGAASCALGFVRGDGEHRAVLRGMTKGMKDYGTGKVELPNSTPAINIPVLSLDELVEKTDDFGSNALIGEGRKGVQGAQPGPALNWMQRVKIAVDAAKGLEFLHEKVQPSIVHRDVRSSNILLFEDFRAKIADFNLSNQAPDMAARLHSTRVLGTFGYHAPEYAMTGQLTQKSDVYSFGVVLLELLTGRKPLDHTMPRGQQSLATPRLTEDKVKQCIDPRLMGEYPAKGVAKLAAVAALCVQYEAEFRPNMSIVVKALSPLLVNKQTPVPAQPPALENYNV
ncbi:hypothetical protein PR202_ga08757 [Eleusine coracana subsp. coracana]|uniref:Protein kinase domain-containing protein n=1 Tax=Eleusine coracana subsp. coracana TaxID=191504 RepID=A0AAV5C254_ELECO|nr:hypothetical protein PR202_ga08757 [Eleusine coracana subsp. coracana]